MLNSKQLLNLLAQLEHPGGGPPKGLSDDDLTELAIKLNADLPDELQQLLRLTNAPFVGGQVLLGVSTQNIRSIESTYKLFPEWHQKGWIPIGADGCGNYYMLLVKGEFGEGAPVVFVEATVNPDKVTYIVASDVEHFVEFLVRHELKIAKWPFDREYVLSKDPKIVDFTGLDLPWS